MKEARPPGAAAPSTPLGPRSHLDPLDPRGHRSCKDHPAVPAATACGWCSRPLCDPCFRFRMDGRPACAVCAYEASTRRSRRASLAVAFLCISVAGGVWLTRRHDLWNQAPVLIIVGALAAIAVAISLGVSSSESRQPELENRNPEEDPIGEGAFTGGGSPYRARARRVLLAASPRVSGSATALVVVASMAACAVLLPASLKLPRWVEAELVLGLWWAIVTATLTALLYRGFRLRDDFLYFAPWDRPASPAGAAGAKKTGSSWDLGDGCVSLDAEGCLVGIAVAVALAVAFGAAWLVVELVAPVTFLFMYWLFMRAIGRVANDHHGCEGSLSKSMGWGALWATIYVAPIGALTWVFHALHAMRG